MPAKSRAHSLVGDHPEGRPKNDFYRTPTEATLALLAKEKFTNSVWESACGDGAISKVLLKKEFKVVSTDIEPRGFGDQLDFFFAPALLAPTIITNPPFYLAQQFAERALALGCEKLALFEKLAFLEGQERSLFLEKSHLKRVWVFSYRLTLTRGDEVYDNGGMISFAWYIWERGYRGETQVGWIRK